MSKSERMITTLLIFSDASYIDVLCVSDFKIADDDMLLFDDFFKIKISSWSNVYRMSNDGVETISSDDDEK